jgi:hypothetical protein
MMTDGLERVWKETVVAKSKCYRWIFLERLSKITKSSRIAGVPGEIWTEQHPNIVLYFSILLHWRKEGRRPLGRPRRRWVDNIKMDLRETGWAAFFSFLILYTVGRTPLTGDQPVARPLPTHRRVKTQNESTQYGHPCLEWDPNPRSQRSSERRQFMPETARPLPLASTYQNSAFCPHSVFLCSVWFSQ